MKAVDLLILTYLLSEHVLIDPASDQINVYVNLDGLVSFVMKVGFWKMIT